MRQRTPRQPSTAVKKARQEKLIGNTLEARVVLHSDSDITEKIDKEELEEFFIVSDLKGRKYTLTAKNLCNLDISQKRNKTQKNFYNSIW